MGFRQNNDKKRMQRDAFAKWRESEATTISLTNLPSTVFDSRDDWQYFVDYSYHDTGNWHSRPFTHIDATLEDLRPEQREAVEQLNRSWEVACEQSPILKEHFSSQKFFDD